MGNIYKFDIVQVFTVDIELNSKKEELVTGLEFSYVGYSGDQNTFIIDSVEIPSSDNNIIPYSELTKDILIEWVTKFISEQKVNEMKSIIDKRLDEMVKHFAQFDESKIDTISKASLFPWASLEIPAEAIEIIGKIDTGNNL